MRPGVTQGLPRTALALALAWILGCTLLTVPSPAAAVTVEQKKAQRDAALRELDSMQEQFAAKADQYAATVQQINQAQRDVSDATSQTAQLDQQLTVAQQALNERAVQLYQTGPLSTIELMLTTQSLSDLVDRTNALMMLSERDAQLAVDVRSLRSDSQAQERRLQDRMAQLTELQKSADEQQQAIQDEIARQQILVRSLGRQISTLIAEQRRTFHGSAPNKGFDPKNVISDANAAASGSMTIPEIQVFLQGQPGSLRSYVGPDHTGARKSAAKIIGEAARANGISPKVLIATLQKEQSLISTPHPSQEAMDWATGCGRPDSGARLTQYQGFGKQVWGAASKLGKEYRAWYHPGITKSIDGSVVHVANYPTFAQYTYTPHLRGVKSFWMLYWRYFGDPLS